MPISIVQQATRVTGGYPSVSASFAATPTPGAGRYVIALANTNPNYAGGQIAGWTFTDNQGSAPGNTYQYEFCWGQANSFAVAWAPIVSSSGVFTITATPTNTPAPDAAVGLLLFEVSGLSASGVRDLLVRINDQVLTAPFNVTTPATDTAEELVFAVFAPASFQGTNASDPPTDYTELFDIVSGDGAGWAAYRLTTATGAQSINLSGRPISGSSSMMVISFRGAGAPSGTIFTRTLVASLTTSGSINKLPLKALAGTTSASGTPRKATTRALTGALQAAGTVAKAAIKRFTGSITTAGVVARIRAKLLAGAITTAGVVRKLTLRRLTGSTTLAGVPRKLASRALTGSMTVAGAVGKGVARSLGGVLTAASVLGRQLIVAGQTFLRSVGGSLAVSGTVTRAGVYTQLLAGSTALAGAIRRTTSRTLGGSVASAGAVSRAITRRLTGSLTAVGAALRNVTLRQALNGAMSVAGALASLYLPYVPPALGALINRAHMTLRRLISRR